MNSLMPKQYGSRFPLNEAIVRVTHSVGTERFWAGYKKLDAQSQKRTTEKYWRWRQTPAKLNFEPKFNKPNGQILVVQITHQVHAICSLNLSTSTVTWLWIGSYTHYEDELDRLRQGQ